MTPLEKAARAACEAQRTHFAIPRMGIRECEWDELSPEMKVRYIDGARAVLMAVREPDHGTAEAGVKLDVELEWLQSERAVPQVFTAMIDHILRGGETQPPSDGEPEH